MDFAEVYAAHFDFVWRSVVHLGVPRQGVDDAVQDVFVVVHRQLAGFEGRSSLRTWIFGIVRKAVRNHRPRGRFIPTEPVVLASVVDARSPSPFEHTARAEAARLLQQLLDQMDDDKREAFVLSEIEELPMPEVAEALGINVHTAYSRVRAARAELEQHMARLRAREGR